MRLGSLLGVAMVLGASVAEAQGGALVVPGGTAAPPTPPAPTVAPTVAPPPTAPPGTTAAPGPAAPPGPTPPPGPTGTAGPPMAPPPGAAPPGAAVPPGAGPPGPGGPPPMYPVVYNPPPPPPPTLIPPPAERDPTRKRFGFHLNLLGPNALVGAGASWQVHRVVELLGSVGYVQVSATEQSAAATAQAKIRIITPTVRGRFWVQRRHSLIFDAVAGVSFMRLNADGNDTSGNTLNYERTGNPAVFAGGVGYGFRGSDVIRFSVLLGAVATTGGLSASTISASPSFNTKEVAELKGKLDETSSELGSKVGSYLELSMGFLF